MYNVSLSAPVECDLDHYRRQGLITLLPWKLPIVSKICCYFYMYNESLSAPVGCDLDTIGDRALSRCCLGNCLSCRRWKLVGCVLDHYRRQGLITLLPWKLPIVSKWGVSWTTIGDRALSRCCLGNCLSCRRCKLVGCVLYHYRRQGLITLLPWKLPIVSKVEIRTEGQFAAFNDCLYRSMQNAGWLLVLDVDELDDTEVKVPLTTAQKTQRWKTPHVFKNRSKYVVRPRDAVELGNHFIWELAPGAVSVGVLPERALLHHYRVRTEGLVNLIWLAPGAVSAGVPPERALLHHFRVRTERLVHFIWELAPGAVSAGVPPERALLHHYRVRTERLVHFIWELAPGAVSAGVPPERALLHHYRIACEYGGMKCLSVPSTIDRTAHRWTDELLKRINTEKKNLDTACPP
ncbi:UPF0392 protein [Operophtera brumata]|uniref:Glycosyltransferase family 92 protein n=1 Tax=Operophtera brumata TaxID=104452 RepID=A0A0L7LGQ5_OPEBR|nr:UPF0392 protein [Operophtera brumata]